MIDAEEKNKEAKIEVSIQIFSILYFHFVLFKKLY